MSLAHFLIGVAIAVIPVLLLVTIAFLFFK